MSVTVLRMGAMLTLGLKEKSLDPCCLLFQSMMSMLLLLILILSKVLLLTFPFILSKFCALPGVILWLSMSSRMTRNSKLRVCLDVRLYFIFITSVRVSVRQHPIWLSSCQRHCPASWGRRSSFRWHRRKWMYV